MKHSLLCRFLLASMLPMCLAEGYEAAADETVLIQDSLQGKTTGRQVGGGFGPEGYSPGLGQNHILYELPRTVREGRVEFEVKGMNPATVPQDGDHAFLGMYDGRGVAEPAEYFRDFKSNFFRWNVHWRQNRNALKCVISCAAPLAERQQAAKAQFADQRDWSHEPTGQAVPWDPAKWHHFRVEWKDKTFQVVVDGEQKWRGAGPYDYAPLRHRIWLGCAPGKPDKKYLCLVKGIVYRNFKVVAYDDGRTQAAKPKVNIAATAPSGAKPSPTDSSPWPALPNIVFILADDLGYGDLSCYGQKLFETPHLDRLAAEGIRFTRHYAGSTVCAPSRCVLMTGLHVGHTPVRTNRDDPMPAAVPTIASLLKSAGYATGCFGKWGVGTTIPPRDPNEKGFDEFYGYVDMFHAHNLFPPFLVRNGQREALGNDLIPGSDQAWPGRGNGVAEHTRDYAPELLVNEALKFVEGNAQKPFFLFLAFNTPHANNEGQAYGRGMEVPDFGPFADRGWPEAEKGFARMMRDLDRDVGRVVAKLREHSLADRTLIVFSSDNGPHQEGGHQVEFFDSNGPLRGKKRDLYEGGVRVPTIAWWPGRVPAGTVTNHLSSFQDWLPTLCELAGAKSPATDGLSLFPTLSGRPADQRQHEALYFEFYEGAGQQAAVTDRWKAVRYKWRQDPDGPMELYDLQSDPGEQRDVAADHPDVVMRLNDFMCQSHMAHSGPTQSTERLPEVNR